METIQQCKNYRINGTILDSLQRISPSNPVKQVVAMDWLGYVGYMFALVDVDGIYHAQQVGVLLLPKSNGGLAFMLEATSASSSRSLGQRTVAAYTSGRRSMFCARSLTSLTPLI